ncbi:hypothetical protein CLU79DRAFT_739389 [Phycomyces nitens]|nr:hypothetical protein CLU79DRAFT_739389 [Phycomyces nitens]
MSVLIDPQTSSVIAGDRLSKRLSGGHYGSAGGLVMSTLPLEDPQEVLVQDDDGQTSISTEYTEGHSITTSSWSIRGPESIACTDISEASSMLHTPVDQQRKEYEQLDINDDEEDGPADYARRIWEEDETVYGDLEHVAEWMGNGKPLSTEILKYYMSHFDFSQMKLEDGFRTLCGKLHLKAEAQQIDRILEVFAQRYFGCNPSCVFGSSDVIHAIIYSAMMLNTDLHVAQGDYKKMSRSAFVRNTMSAILSQGDCGSQDTEYMRRTPSAASADPIRPTTRYSKAWQVEIETVLKLMYASIRARQVLHPAPKHEASHQHARRRSLQVTGSRVGAFKRSVGTIMWKAARESIFVNDLAEFDAMYSPGLPVSPRLGSPPELPTFYGAGVPYYKDGLLVRKHLLEKANQKARHREWRDCFMVIERGEIRMYKSDNAGQDPRKSIIRSTMMASRPNISDALSHCQDIDREGWQRMGEIDLKHTLSNPLPSGYSRQRPHAFALQQPSGGVYLFQVGSASEVLEWVETCNYWAARESREPLTGGVSNMEYGWGECLEGIGLDATGDPYYLVQSRDTTVHEWQPPVPPSASSTMDEQAQLEALHRHVRELNEELDRHRDIKLKMELRFLKAQGIQAMANWENKSHYLLHEIIKYQNYCDAIEKVILAGKATPEEKKLHP